MVEYAVKNRASSGLLVKDLNQSQQEELASFLIIRQDGAMSCLHTLSKYRGKGFASVTVRDLMHKFSKQHNLLPPYCYIVIGNESSEQCFKKLGFEVIGDISWLYIAKKEL